MVAGELENRRASEKLCVVREEKVVAEVGGDRHQHRFRPRD